MDSDPPDAAGGVAVVTGATGGIGRWIAAGLAEAGRRVVLVGRDAGRAAAARDWIATRAPAAAVEVALADLSSLAETRRLGSKILARHPRIGILVNNAGVFEARRRETAEGHETVLAVNHLAPFVLARALEPGLLAGAPSRIVTVGSSLSDSARIDPAGLELTRGWGMIRAYGQSKLAVMMATFAEAERLRGTGVTANVVHPGFVASGLIRTPGAIGLAWRLLAPFGLSEAAGAKTPLHVALAPELATVTGRYFKENREARPNRRVRDAALVAAVMAATEALVRAPVSAVGGAGGAPARPAG